MLTHPKSRKKVTASKRKMKEIKMGKKALNPIHGLLRCENRMCKTVYNRDYNACKNMLRIAKNKERPYGLIDRRLSLNCLTSKGYCIDYKSLIINVSGNYFSIKK